MDRNLIKDKVQRDSLNTWFQSGCKGTLELATGVGKTRCGVLAASYFAELVNYDFKVLILTPTETIRDMVWEKEFIKWKKARTFKECVKVVCIQTAYKWSNEHFDLVIVDEIHTTIPTFEDFRNKKYEYFKFYENNTFDKILGLSASIDTSRSMVLNQIAKVIVRIGVPEAKRLKLISDFNIYNLEVELTPQERLKYDHVNKNFEKYFRIFVNTYAMKDIKIMYKCMKEKQFFEDHCKRLEIDYQAHRSYPFLANKAMQERKDMLYGAQNKLVATKAICDMFPDRLGIIFSQSILFADIVDKLLGETCVPFHSKIPKKKRYADLKWLNDGRTKVNRISAVSALNEGLDIPDCSLAVITAGDSKRKSWIQRVGRSVRWQEDKVAVIVRLYVKGTQEEKWLRSSQQGGADVKNVTNVQEIIENEKNLMTECA